MDGISRASIEAHYKLYQGYVAKRNEILTKLGEVDLAAANQVYSEIPSAEGRPHLRHRRRQEPRDLLRAPSAAGRQPRRGDRRADRAGLRQRRRLARRLAGDGDGRPRLGLDGVRLRRAAPLQLRGRRAEHVPDLERAPLVALDVYEHAYFLDYQTDRASYIEAFFGNLDWDVVNGWVDAYAIQS